MGEEPPSLLSSLAAELEGIKSLTLQDVKLDAESEHVGLVPVDAARLATAFDLTAQVNSAPAEGPVQPGKDPLLMDVTHLGLRGPGFMGNMRNCGASTAKLYFKPCPGEESIDLDQAPYCGTIQATVCDTRGREISSVWAGFYAGEDITACIH